MSPTTDNSASKSMETSGMEYSVSTFAEDIATRIDEQAERQEAPTHQASARLRRSSTIDDRIDMDDDYNNFPTSHTSHRRRPAQKRSRSVLSNFSLDSIASRVEAAFDQSRSRRRSVQSQISEDEIDRLLEDRDGDSDEDDNDQEEVVAPNRLVGSSSPRRGRRPSWARSSMISYLTDDGEALDDVIMEELSKPLPLDSSDDDAEEKELNDRRARGNNSPTSNNKRSRTRRCLALLAIAGIAAATTFAAGYFYASDNPSPPQTNRPVDTSNPSQYDEFTDPSEYHVTQALEDVLQDLQVVDANDQPSDDIFSPRPPKHPDIQVLVRCDEPEGCLEAMKMSSSVHVVPTKDLSRVSLNVQPEHFNDLRSVHGLHMDVDHMVEAIEDDVEDADTDDIDLADLIQQQRRHGGGSIRGRQRRAQQYVSEGFRMIQAITDDGSPFPPGPHRKLICVPDTGTCKNHPDLVGSRVDGIDLVMDDGQTVLRWDQDVEGHGCHNNGLISAVDNDFGYVGIGGSDVFITRGLQDDKRATVSHFFAAVEQCVNAGASIIVLSLGCNGCRDALDEDYFQSLANKGIMIFAASGNIGGDPNAEMMYPASFPRSVISVGAVNADESVWHKSASNEQVQFCAHGSSVVSTGFALHDDTYQYNFVRKSGTSMSTPQVATVASHLWSHYPRCTPDQIISVLAATAKKVDTGSGRLEKCTPQCGVGIPQLQDAYKLVDSTKSFPGVSQDYDCDVGGLILSSTDRVCDCIESNGDPSKCIDPNTSVHERSPLDLSEVLDEPSSDPVWPDEAEIPSPKQTVPRCKDKQGARFRLNVSREKKANARDLQNVRRRRRNKPRGCKYIRKKSTRAQFWCNVDKDVRRSCQRSCASLAGIVYNDCST